MSELIFDVGMWNGEDTEYYLARGFKVVAIDADPKVIEKAKIRFKTCLLYTSPSPRDRQRSRMPSSA